jgi:hypothetical protein
LELLYGIVGGADVRWLAAIGVMLLVLDVFFLGTTILLLLSFSFFIFIGLAFYIDSAIILTWSIPAIIMLLFLAQRSLINLTIFQKSIYQETRSGTFKAVVKLAENPNDSHDYFYGFKDEKQVITEDASRKQMTFKAVLNDGRSYILPYDSNLSEGQNVKITVSDSETAKVVKNYG